MQVTKSSPDGDAVEIVEHQNLPEFDYYVASLGEELEEGDVYFISMEFQGILNDQLRGFYRSSYKEDGQDV